VKCDSSLDPIELNRRIENTECDIGTNTNNITEDKIVPELGRKIRSTNNKIKKVKKLMLKSESATDYQILSGNDNLCNQNSNPPIDETKKSYSSVIKSSLVKESNPNPTISKQPKVEIVPIHSPLPTTPICPAVQTNTEQDSDNWQKVPLADSKHEIWQKTERKRKQRKKKIQFENSPQPEEIPDLEVVPRIEESLKPIEVEKVLENETVPEEENENTEQEKKKLRRRKKKHGSEGPEEINAAHRVVIRDDQVTI
jgi:hypothetical protein